MDQMIESALAPLFTHATFSEVHFLNLMQKQLDAVLGSLVCHKRRPEFGLESLQYFASIPDRHACQLSQIHGICWEKE